MARILKLATMNFSAFCTVMYSPLLYISVIYTIAGPLLGRGRSKWPLLWWFCDNLYFDHLGNGSGCSRRERWFTARVIQEVRGSPIPSAEILGV